MIAIVNTDARMLPSVTQGRVSSDVS